MSVIGLLSTREKTLYTRQQATGTIRKYNGETIGNQQAHTGWAQGTTPYIQNWYTSDNDRVLFDRKTLMVVLRLLILKTVC